MTNATPYLLTASGQRYRLTGPDLDTPRIGDIAHHLAQINRFTGAASRPYSVAEHSLLCEHIAASEGAGPMARLCALMHDAHEAYCSDMASPAKVALCEFADANSCNGSGESQWEHFERVHQYNVLKSFGLIEAMSSYPISLDVKRWDLIALATERRDLMPPDDGEGWEILRGVEAYGPPGTLNDCGRDTIGWASWREIFQHKFLMLTVDGQV